MAEETITITRTLKLAQPRLYRCRLVGTRGERIDRTIVMLGYDTADLQVQYKRMVETNEVWRVGGDHLTQLGHCGPANPEKLDRGDLYNLHSTYPDWYENPYPPAEADEDADNR